MLSMLSCDQNLMLFMVFKFEMECCGAVPNAEQLQVPTAEPLHKLTAPDSLNQWILE